MTKKKEKNLQSSGLADLQTAKTLTRHFVTPSPKGRGERTGFTLAEVLITLGIIGIVAAMTIPTLVADYQERSFNTADSVFQRKLGEALKVMNSQMTLAGHTSTESFVNELKKHIKITKTCANDKLMDCFESEVFWGDNAEAVDMTVVKKAKNFGQKDWQETNVIGVQFANGVSALIAYNKDAKQDPYSNQIVNISGSTNGKKGSVSLGTTALAILYDTNGYKTPNKSAKDLRSINVTKLGKSCFAEANGVCIAMAPQVPTPHKWNACQSDGTSTDPEDQKFMSDYGIKCMNPSNGTNDYWAGAAKLCGGTDKMASMEDLGKIAAYVYNQESVGAKQDVSSLTFDATKAAELGLPSPSFYLWSGEENSEYYACHRTFGSSYTGWTNGTRYHSNPLAVCLGD